MSQYRRRYSPVPIGLYDEALVKRLIHDLQDPADEVLPSRGKSQYVSDDNLSPESGNDWHANSCYLRFGYRESGKIIGTTVNRVSDMPFSDRVLTKNGNDLLTSNAIRAIKRFSTMFVDSGNIHVHDGPFGCIFSNPETKEVPIVTGDRPFPYFYSRNAPGLKGRLFHTARTSAGGRVVKFVKVGGDHLVPDELREQILYLFPGEEDFCADVPTKLLPLDWQPSCEVCEGEGRNIYISERRIWTTDREKSFEEDKRISKGLPIGLTVLEVRGGVIENVALDEKLYHPDVVKMAREAAGKRVLIYRFLHEAMEEYYICRRVLKRMKKYEQLLEKTGGHWPRTVTALSSCLSVSLIEVLVAGIYDSEVRKRFPELLCFLGRGAECLNENTKDLRGRRLADDPALRANSHVTDLCRTRLSTLGVEEAVGIPMDVLMTQFYVYSPVTKSYYAINRLIDKPVSLLSDGRESGSLH